MHDPWSAEEFVARIDGIGDERYHHRHPFHLQMHDGGLDEAAVRAWVLNRYYYQRSIPVKDALILAKLPTRHDRRKWLLRIIDQDGHDGDEGGLEAWLQLADAVGLSRQAATDELKVLPAVRFAVDAYVNFCRLQPWQDCVAASLTQRFAPDLMLQRIQAFDRHYPWVKPEGMAYFRRRISNEPKESEHALELLLSAATTRDDQERALEALRFKCDVLWAILDALDANAKEG